MKASGYERHAQDYYREPKWIVDALLAVERFPGLSLDPACGSGTIPQAMADAGLDCIGSDIASRAPGYAMADFLAPGAAPPAGVCHIVTNPPYGVIVPWIDRALALTKPAGGKVAVLARLAFLEGQARRTWFQARPLARVWVSSRRPSMPPGDSDEAEKPSGGSVAFAWFVFDHSRLECAAPVLGWLP